MPLSDSVVPGRRGVLKEGCSPLPPTLEPPPAPVRPGDMDSRLVTLSPPTPRPGLLNVRIGLRRPGLIPLGLVDSPPLPGEPARSPAVILAPLIDMAAALTVFSGLLSCAWSLASVALYADSWSISRDWICW